MKIFRAAHILLSSRFAFFSFIFILFTRLFLSSFSALAGGENSVSTQFQDIAKEEKKTKTIGIFCYKDDRVAPWDPDSINRGIAGSEEAVIYLSQELAKQGYQVTVFAQPPAGSKHSTPHANPRFVSADFPPNMKLDIAVSWRMPWKGEELKKKATKVYYWPHDVAYGGKSEKEIFAFDDVLWLSQWQRAAWVSYAPAWAKFDKIFGNGIDPDQFRPVQERKNPHSCIWGSNYARGLEQLLAQWPMIKQKFPNATLDIYYGWETWGLISPDQEAKMRAQIDQYASSGVCEHGKVSHQELNRAYEQASLWTYPCTLPETFCITALRAQLAGATPVIIEGTALSETVNSGYKCKTQEEYLPLLFQAMEKAESTSLQERKKMGEFVLNNYTWERIANKWILLFESCDALR